MDLWIKYFQCKLTSWTSGRKMGLPNKGVSMIKVLSYRAAEKKRQLNFYEINLARCGGSYL